MAKDRRTREEALRDGPPISSLVPRRPVQKRSRERFERVLDATDALLGACRIEEVGLYDIAKRADLPPASVYHLFPSREAAFAALAQRYLDLLDTLNETPLPKGSIVSWQSYMSASLSRSIDFYNRHPVFMALFLGGAVCAEVRQQEFQFNQRYAETTYARLDRMFVMPDLPDVSMPFYVLLGIFDGLASASYGRFGRVTDAYRDQMIRAVVTYLETVLPPHVAART